MENFQTEHRKEDKHQQLSKQSREVTLSYVLMPRSGLLPLGPWLLLPDSRPGTPGWAVPHLCQTELPVVELCFAVMRATMPKM